MCSVEFGYQNRICCRSEENHGKNFDLFRGWHELQDHSEFSHNTGVVSFEWYNHCSGSSGSETHTPF